MFFISKTNCIKNLTAIIVSRLLWNHSQLIVTGIDVARVPRENMKSFATAANRQWFKVQLYSSYNYNRQAAGHPCFIRVRITALAKLLEIARVSTHVMTTCVLYFMQRIPKTKQLTCRPFYKANTRSSLTG